MVTWSDDVNLERICEGINKYIAHYKMNNYHIYGLQLGDRPHVRISPRCPEVLKDLFKRSGYVLEVKEVSERHCSDCDDTHSLGNCHCELDEGCTFCRLDTVSIGIRRDIRSNIQMTRKLIKTIIFAVEDKLIVGPDVKLKLTRVRKTLDKPVKKDKKAPNRPDYHPDLTQTPAYNFILPTGDAPNFFIPNIVNPWEVAINPGFIELLNENPRKENA